jgi:TonB family protein
VSIQLDRNVVKKISALVFVACLYLPAITAANDKGTDTADAKISAALCQVVYPLDQTPEDGYRYMFFGNGFFVNRDGYVVTAAHLLSYFRNGGEPYVLVGPREGPRRMLEAPIEAVDWEHDVAVLKATPNPFQSDSKIAYLPLSTKMPTLGNDVLSASLRPPDIENAHSAAQPLEDFSQGQVINYQFYADKPSGEEKELLLFNQPVLSGQSGSPLVSAKSHAAIGVVVGQWLHPAVIPSGASGGHLTMAPGAALRIHYAIALLQQKQIPWEMASESPEPNDPAKQPEGFSAPVPLSVVGTPYPPQVMFGGDVLLDALIASNGKLADVRVVAGDPPFADTALSAVRTWSFAPARKDGRAVESRIGIVFQFPQSLLPAVVSKEHKHPEIAANSEDHPALPALTIEPDYPANSIAQGSVVLYGAVDAQGRVISTSVLSNVDSLTAPTEAAVRKWQFVPAREAGVNTDSAVIVVVTFRRVTL